MRAVAIVFAISWAGVAAAQPALRDGDRPFGPEELAALVYGHAIEFHDGGVSRYRVDGVYSWKYSETDRPYLGRYEIGQGGEVCVTFGNDVRGCDTFAADGARMVVVIADGTRFPVRDRRSLVDGY